MERLDASELAHRLARNAEAVCRHYLSAGRREGAYWLVGDARNTPGRSLFVRLKQTAKGPAGKWTDAATGEHGDLLDVIRESRGLTDSRTSPTKPVRSSVCHVLPRRPTHTNALIAPTRCPDGIVRGGAPLVRHVATNRAHSRGSVFARTQNTALHGTASLRFHPRCYYRPDEHHPTETWPAMIAAVTDLSGLSPARIAPGSTPAASRATLGKAPIETPRRAMGDLLGHAVRFGIAGEVLTAGEGIETMLSLHCVLPSMPMVAALSAAHLSAICSPTFCGGSTSPATTIGQATSRRRPLSTARSRSGSRRWCSHPL